MNWLRSLLLALVIVLSLPLSAPAATQTILGKNSNPAVVDNTVPPAAGPLSIFVGDNGSLQAKRGASGEGVSGMFFGSNFGPAANYWHLRVKGGSASNTTFGPRDTQTTSVSNTLSGDYTAASPARVDTVMTAGAGPLFEIKQTTLYVAPELRYRVIWDIKNVSESETVPFVFGTSADLFIESDAGRGVFIDGDNRFIGGTGFTGKTGGIEEVTASQLPGEVAATPVARWASWEEGDPFPVTRRLSTSDAFLNTINPDYMDNGVGVSFDDQATTGLAPQQSVRYEVIWHLQRPTPPSPSPTPLAPSEPLPSAQPPGAPLATPPLPPDSTARDTGGAAAGVATGADAAAAANADTKAPVVSALRAAPAARSAPKIVFSLSERATVVLRVVRRARGRRVPVRTLTRLNLRAGRHTARIGGKRLVPGSYVVLARAVDAAGNKGTQRSATFRIAGR